MPNRKGYLWGDLATEETARAAMMLASRHGKKRRASVACHFEPGRFEEDSKWLAELVREKRYAPAHLKTRVVQDGPHKKPRKITEQIFWPDLCVQWMLMLTIEPIITRGMDRYCTGSVPGRGNDYAVKAVRGWIESDPTKTTWCLQMDIAKFYEHIDKKILKKSFRRIIKDKNVLWLIDTIIDSHENGVPIGYYTSQWFANWYLQDFDHWIKETLHVPHYLRHVDDLILLGPNKRELLRDREKIVDYLRPLGLHIKSQETDAGKTAWDIFKPRERKIVFLGKCIEAKRVDAVRNRYKFVVTMTRENMLRMTRRITKIHEKGDGLTQKDAQAVVSFYGQAEAGNNWRFIQERLKPYADKEKARKVISNADKMQAAARKAVQRGAGAGTEHGKN